MGPIVVLGGGGGGCLGVGVGVGGRVVRLCVGEGLAGRCSVVVGGCSMAIVREVLKI
jgi:hypothetical protein